LNIVKKTNYIIVEDADDFSSVPVLDDGFYKTNPDVYAVIFKVNASFSISPEQREKLLELPCITVLYSTDASGIMPESLMNFDIRLSDKPFVPEVSGLQSVDRIRFRKLFGRKRAYELERFIQTGDLPDDGLGMVRVIDEGGCEAYMNRLFGDKTAFQTGTIVKALTAFRCSGLNACSDEESVGFYDLIKENAGE
jgi:hypothetical protein